jgi:hypothetical protein
MVKLKCQNAKLDQVCLFDRNPPSSDYPDKNETGLADFIPPSESIFTLDDHWP